MNCKTVFVTQIPNRRDVETGIMKPVFNISPAAEHGKINVMMPSGHSIFNTAEAVTQLRNALSQYSYVRGDSLMVSGDPTIITIAAAILSERTRSIRILRWEKQVRRYIPIEIHL